MRMGWYKKGYVSEKISRIKWQLTRDGDASDIWRDQTCFPFDMLPISFKNVDSKLRIDALGWEVTTMFELFMMKEINQTLKKSAWLNANSE